MYLGSWSIDDWLTFMANTHTFATGIATDADAVPSYRVYEDETGTAILTGDMAKLDDANTTGFYTERIQLTAASGFENGKTYTIYVTATVAGVTGTMSHTFQVAAAVSIDNAAIADAVWDEARAGHIAAGSFGEGVVVSDKTGFSLSAAGVQAIWDALTSALTAVGSIGKMLVDRIVGTLLAGNHTAQTGDSYARLGAPTGASISADIADIHTDVSTLPAGVADSVWDELRTGHVIVGSFGEGVASVIGSVGGTVGSGTGALVTTITVNDGSNPIDGVEVWISTDQAGTSVIAGTLITDAMGVVTFMLDAGTYYVWKQRSGYNFTNPEQIIVS